MQSDKSLLDGIISDYFNSIYRQFEYRRKNKWKIEFFSVLYNMSILFTILNVIPFLPGVSDNYLHSLYLSIKQYLTGTPFKDYNFYTKWLLGLALSLVILAITYPFSKYWNVQEKRYSLSRKLLMFCYVYTVRTELKSYLINDNSQHIENSKNFFKQYIKTLTYRNYEGESDKTISAHIGELTSQLKEKYSWIQFDESTEDIINALSSVEEKILERLIQKVDLEKIVPLIEYLVLYEFSKIKKDELATDGTPLSHKRLSYILSFADGINSLEKIEIANDNANPSKNLISEMIHAIPALFSSNNIFVLFISWLILLISLFVPISLLIISNLKLKVDSTIIIGIISSPFIGAITLVATIYSKNKKTE